MLFFLVYKTNVCYNRLSMNGDVMDIKYYSITALNRAIKNMFDSKPELNRVYIKGEISNFKHHSRGHLYFTLKDENSRIAAVMFATNAKNINFEPEDGMKVLVSGRVTVYEATGGYQIYVEQMDLDGIGNLYLEYEKLKKMLEEQGLFNKDHKRPIPRFPKKIGIITAPTGAAIRDILSTIKRRYPICETILFPALVQGVGAKESIVTQLNRAQDFDLDVIICGRGGGSIEDLWAFNEEIVARAVFDCSVPVISAVGHETDWTIVDFVADQRAPTPSAAAELAVFDYRIIMQELDSRQELLMRELKRKLEKAELRLGQFRLKLKLRSPLNRLNENRSRIADYEEKTELVMKQKLLAYRHKLKLLAQRLEGDSPVKKLGGGYAFVSINGKGLKHVSDTKTGDELQIYLPDGTIRAKVEETEPKTEES